jgi:hypothetical protein
MASSIRDLQILAQQHFAVRDPVIATDGAALIGSDGYLMSLRRNAVVTIHSWHMHPRKPSPIWGILPKVLAKLLAKLPMAT